MSTPSSTKTNDNNYPLILQKSSNYFQTLFLELAPGATQGSISAFFGHPFDTIKTRTQDAAFFYQQHKQNNKNVTTTSALRVTLDTYKNNGGIRAFYRGVTIPIFVKSAQRSLQYALWDVLKAEPFNMDAFSSGAIVGAVGTIVVGCPAHVVKIHSQVSGKQMNAFHTAIALLKSDKGFFRSFFAGLPANIVKDTVFASTYLGIYDTYKKKIRPGCTAAESACCASVVSWLVFLPLDTLKTVLQSPHYGTGSSNEVNNSSSSLSSTKPSSSSSFLKRATSFAKQHGTLVLIKKAWAGLIPALLRAGPANAVAMTGYEYAKQWTAPKKAEKKKWRQEHKTSVKKNEQQEEVK